MNASQRFVSAALAASLGFVWAVSARKSILLIAVLTSAMGWIVGSTLLV